MKTLSRLLFVLSLSIPATLMLPVGSQANLRAPRDYPGGTSSALIAPDDTLMVLGETLSITCGETDYCRVLAVYLVRAQRAQSVELQFIFSDALNSDLLIEVETGQGKFPAREVTALSVTEDDLISPEQLREKKERYFDRTGQAYETARKAKRVEGSSVSFVIDMAKGINTITVQYQQKLGLIERGHSYFGDGELRENFSYELWPIRGWQRAADFEIDFSVVFKRDTPNWWQRNIGSYRDLQCSQEMPPGSENAWQGKLPPSKQLDEYTAGFRHSFPRDMVPDRVYCEFTER